MGSKHAKRFIKDTLKTETVNLEFDRAHRLGNQERSKKPLPINAKFHYYNQRETVRKTALQLKEGLKALNYGVGVLIPKKWRNSSRNLNQVYLDERHKREQRKICAR